MIPNIHLALWLGMLVATAPSPPAGSAYEQALAGLEALASENLALRARIAQLEQNGLPTVSISVGGIVHVRADELEPLDLEPHLQALAWNFGDPGSDYDDLGGFNAAHVYEEPGTFTIRLNDRPVRRVVVTPESRPVRAVNSAAELAVAARIGGTFIQLPAGTMPVSATITLAPGVVMLGDPAGSTLLWSGAPGGLMFHAPNGGVTVRGITFDTAQASGGAGFEKSACEVLRAGGSDVALLDCTFLNVSYGINGNGRPKRVLMQGCRAPLETGIRAYLAWVEGEQWVIVGNTAANSTREHIVRCGASGPGAPGSSWLLVAYNDFANIDRRQAAERPDAHDTAKSCLIFQVGQYAWAERNLFRGISGVGPLGEGDGLKEPERRFRHAVFRDNRHLDTLHVEHGSEHVLVAGSRLELPRSGGDGSSSLKIEGFHADFNRGVVDLAIRECLWISPYRDARQLWVQGAVAQRLELIDNQFVAGSEGFKWAGMPIVIEGGWQAHYVSRGNALPPAPGAWPYKDAVVRIGDQNDPASYLTPEAWSRLTGVSGDRFGER